MMLWLAFAQLLAGFVCAGFGGEAFVRGCANTAALLRIPGAIIAVTIAAFATSSPELSVAINAALAGTPEIALGDALGSNIVNVALILGLVLCFGGMPASRRAIGRDGLLALAAPILLGALGGDGVLDAIDGAILLVLFAAWLAVVVVTAGRHRRADTSLPVAVSKANTLIMLMAGFGLLVLAGMLIVTGAKVVGGWLGLDPFITGVTLVALGTSMPELATSLIARWRGHHDIGLNTVVGSNIFNVLCIVAVAACIHPISVAVGDIAFSIMAGLAALMLVFPNANGFIPRWRALPLLAVYAAYVTAALA